MTDGPRKMKRHAPPRLRVKDSVIRGSRQDRGYDGRWERVQRVKKKSNPLCEQCLANGQLKTTQMVHHLIPTDIRPDLILEWTNLQSLCWSCHAAINHDQLRKDYREGRLKLISEQSRDMQGALYS